MLAFLLVAELSVRVSASWAFPLLVGRVVVPLVLLMIFRSTGAYQELRFSVAWKTLADLLIGILLALVWMVPYLVVPSLRPDGSEGGFDPAMLGATLAPLVISIRMLGYAFVTPFMEELFMRSFLMRYADAFDSDEDFRSLPIGRYTLRSFLVVVAVFVVTHVTWEWWVMLPWAILSNLWFYYRKDLFAIVVVHAATNATILLSAVFLSRKFNDGEGGLLSLWFFV